MEELAAEVAPPIFVRQTFGGRFCEGHPVARKRGLPHQSPNFQQQQVYSGFQSARDGWIPKAWDWDSVRFVAKPLESDVLKLGPATSAESERQRRVEESGAVPMMLKKNPVHEEDESLQLKLGGGSSSGSGLNPVEEPVSRSNKRVRSGSPGSIGYPMCQVDTCKEDLTNAKDYHRRHKVCEVHSKSGSALVGKHMQRFCQQCSRFHPLSEFDEGKRSCRRRLAGHNRRRRKTQPEDLTTKIPGNHNNTGSENLDIVNLLTVLAHAQGNFGDKSSGFSPVPNRDHLTRILSKINSLPLLKDFAAKLCMSQTSSGNIPEQVSAGNQSRLKRDGSYPSTMDFLALLSATSAASAPDTLAEKTKLTSLNQDTVLNLQKGLIPEFPSAAGERSSTSFHSLIEDSDCQVQETQANLSLQLFSSSPEDDSQPKLASTSKYFSSDNSIPMDECSPSSSPPVMQKLFPIQTSRETGKSEKTSVSRREVNANLEAGKAYGCVQSLDLFGDSNGVGGHHGSLQSFPAQAGYTSSSGSDHSPSSSSSDSQDRTGRIIFKLFDKDPSHLPGTLRTQIYNWLSHSPSEMESYIRPGCVVLSIYLSMSYSAWKQLEENLLHRVDSLMQDSESDFWRSGRFLVQTDRQLVSLKDGKILLCKSWKTLTSPELVSVSPLAVVGGQVTSLLLRGRNLSATGTSIHCTDMGSYISKEASGSACQEIVYDDSWKSFKCHGVASCGLGRFFIEVENGCRSCSFPVIIADAKICQELRVLESELDEGAKADDSISEESLHNSGQPRSREEVMHFLNELGWLFQKNKISSPLHGPDYELVRFKFLFIFSVERDCYSLVKTLLDLLLERNVVPGGISNKPLEMLSEIHLLNRAVKLRSRKMVDLLIHYSILSNNGTSKKYIFPPNVAGPGGITPLHLAACTASSDDLVDALTSDPQEIGLRCWNSILDKNGLSPYVYALMRNNVSYNTLVARKLADRKNDQVSLLIGNENKQLCLTEDQDHRQVPQFKRGQRSCSKCAVMATRYHRNIPGSQSFIQRSYLHSVLAVAAVCVCVCLFLRGSPDIGSVAPFKWENLGYGTI